jgi:2-isopropylmalate synthase
VDTQRGGRRWSTVGASTNIIEASWRALVDAIEYGLTVAQEPERPLQGREP